ncbi:4'-phosphopantetheinyl transferase family protein [Streptomyces griseorubiginosus]|uniref:4'-phosphopantetheinyl transferase family protein n=1 Tax=Streptomyces griseorubiginosus TaxID=67304 RepID=UPI002E810515|nr:4'-phosphopantetheinyl transferase superfamily protein [Streptomyces griseorubiginosus]WUB43102.1 4'-phosphopantetheinyl transferase superfamily protein [Streptomyces griseorubiginosus]WUB51620.1 4'-phosphopantetheinyl transferase superfamily protein [Streptomyces griseorubiginosus]
MIGELLPDSVVAVEAYGADEPENAWLYPEEAELIALAVPKRRREFAQVRACARRAMEKLGVPAQPLLPGERGAPQWPAGLTGSMTHCDGYRAAALVRSADLASLGIDAEPHGPLPEGVLESVSLPGERVRLSELAGTHPAVHWDRLLFSAKESVYKAWFPLTGKWLDFSGADIAIHVDPGKALGGTLRAELLVPGPLVGGVRRGVLEGRWTIRDGLVATSMTVPHA